MTSEQKLLQLIRRSSKERKESGFAPAAPEEAAHQGRITERFWFQVNRLLVVIIAALAAGMIWRYTILRGAYSVPVAAEIEDVSQAQTAPDLDPVSSFDDVRDVFAARNIFQPPVTQEIEEQPAEVVLPQIDLSKEFRVVGIVLGDQPTAIVESIQNSSTVFLGIGDMLDQAVVKEILHDKVILELNGQRIELHS